jgi:sporulation-control protein spo0M
LHDVCNNNKKVQNHFWFNFFRGGKERKGILKVEGANINAVMSECQLKLCFTSAAWEETSRGDTYSGTDVTVLVSQQPSHSHRVTARQAARLPSNFSFALAPGLAPHSKL